MTTLEKQIAPQIAIESKMREIVQLGNFESVFLFSDEGLPLARATASAQNDEEQLAELSLMFQNLKNLASTIGGIERLKEVFIEGENHQKVVFRFFRAFSSDVVLAAVIPPRKAYRKLTNDLQRLILSFQI